MQSKSWIYRVVAPIVLLLASTPLWAGGCAISPQDQPALYRTYAENIDILRYFQEVRRELYRSQESSSDWYKFVRRLEPLRARADTLLANLPRGEAGYPYVAELAASSAEYIDLYVEYGVVTANLQNKVDHLLKDLVVTGARIMAGDYGAGVGQIGKTLDGADLDRRQKTLGDKFQVVINRYEAALGSAFKCMPKPW